MGKIYTPPSPAGQAGFTISKEPSQQNPQSADSLSECHSGGVCGWWGTACAKPASSKYCLYREAVCRQNSPPRPHAPCELSLCSLSVGQTAHTWAPPQLLSQISGPCHFPLSHMLFFEWISRHLKEQNFLSWLLL